MYRHGHQSSSSAVPNPHVEGVAFFKDPSKGGGYYRMKMSICDSAFETDACMQVPSMLISKRRACHPRLSRHFLVPRNFAAQMVPDLWMTPLLSSPLIDSSILAVKSTEICAKAAGKASSSSLGRGIFDHSNSLIGSESELSRACAHCASLIAFQERCIVVDQASCPLDGRAFFEPHALIADKSRPVPKATLSLRRIQ